MSGSAGGAVLPTPWSAERARRAVGTALWVFVAVASTLFALFLTAFAMRMDSPDWSPVRLPPQLWLSTALLVAGSVALHLAGGHAQAMRQRQARRLLLAGGAAAAAFLLVQLWAWQDLVDARVRIDSNVSASFFYLLTALHGLHVIGGLIAWSIVASHVLPAQAEARAEAWRITLCARYWHFLLAVWLVLYSALLWLTPEIVRFICGRG